MEIYKLQGELAGVEIYKGRKDKCGDKYNGCRLARDRYWGVDRYGDRQIIDTYIRHMDTRRQKENG